MRLTGAVLGNVFVFGGHVFFGVYAAGERAHGISPGADQNAAGAIMMVEGSILTLALFGWLFARAASEGEERQELLDLAAARGVALSEARAARAVAAGRGAELRRRIESGAVDGPCAIWTTSTASASASSPGARCGARSARPPSGSTRGRRMPRATSSSSPMTEAHPELARPRGALPRPGRARDVHRRRRGARRPGGHAGARRGRHAPLGGGGRARHDGARGRRAPGAALPRSPFEHYYAAQPAYDAGDYDRAVAIAGEGLADWPEHGR